VTIAAPTFSQIKAQVAAIRQKVPHARVIGIRAEGRWTGERLKQDGQETFRIEQCDSPLHMRMVLQDDADVAITVLITSLEERELGDDILVRLARRRLFPIDSWQIVKLLFQARAIDPRVTQHGWMAECLLEAIPVDGFPPAPGGFLDAETVWPILLDQHIGFVSDRPDLLALLQWSVNTESRPHQLPSARPPPSGSRSRLALLPRLSSTVSPPTSVPMRWLSVLLWGSYSMVRLRDS
jgi:hypothetical protein